MSIKIKIPIYLRDKTDGESIIDITGDTIRDCVTALVLRYPALKGEIVDGQGKLLLKWLISVNQEIVSTPDELSHRVTNGDVITLVPVVAGG